MRIQAVEVRGVSYKGKHADGNHDVTCRAAGQPRLRFTVSLDPETFILKHTVINGDRIFNPEMAEPLIRFWRRSD